MKTKTVLGLCAVGSLLAGGAYAQISPSLGGWGVPQWGEILEDAIEQEVTQRPGDLATLSQCSERDFYLEHRHDVEVGAACAALLSASAEARSVDWPELREATCSGPGDICRTAPEVFAYQTELADPPRTFGFNGLLSSGREQSRLALSGDALAALADNATKTQWEDNCGVFSCEEYAFEKYVELEALDQRALELRDEPDLLAEELLGAEGIVERRASGPAEITFLRKNGEPATSIELDTARLAELENPFRQFARLFLHKDADDAQLGHGYGYGPHNCGPETPDPYDPGWGPAHLFSESLGLAMYDSYFKQPDPSVFGTVGFERQRLLRAGTAAYDTEVLEYVAGLKREFLAIVARLKEVDEPFERGGCKYMRPETLELVAELSRQATPYLEFAEAVGCLDEGFTMCDWAPSELKKALLQENTGVGAALSRRESDFQACLRSTGNNFTSLRDSSWLLEEQARLGGAECVDGFCDCASEEWNVCSVPVTLATDSVSVDAYVDMIPRWLEQLGLPRDPSTGEFAVRQGAGEVGRMGNGSFSTEMSYHFGWELEGADEPDLCDATLVASGSVMADASAYGYSTLPDSCVPLKDNMHKAHCVELGHASGRHLFQAGIYAESSRTASKVGAGVFVLGDEIYGGEEESQTTTVHLTGDERRSETFVQGSTVVPVGGIPLTITIGVAGGVGFRTDMSVKRGSCSELDDLSLTSSGTFEPFGRVDAFASLSLDAWVAEAGVRTDLLVFELGLPFHLGVETRADGDALSMEAGAELALRTSMLRGSVTAFVEVETLVDGTKRWSKRIIGWPGISSSTELFGQQLSFPLNRVRDALVGADHGAPRPSSGNQFESLCPVSLHPPVVLDLSGLNTVGCVPVYAPALTAAITGGYSDSSCQTESTTMLTPRGVDLGIVYVDTTKTVDLGVKEAGSEDAVVSRGATIASGEPATKFSLSTPSTFQKAQCVPVRVGLLDSNDAPTSADKDIFVQMRAVGGRLYYDDSCSSPTEAIVIPTGRAGETVFAVADSDDSLEITASAQAMVTEVVTRDTSPAVSTTCGDGQLDPAEQCDDGDTASKDGCSEFCLIESGFACSPSSCSSLVTPVCGDGEIHGSESCDDGALNGTLCPEVGCSFCSESCSLLEGTGLSFVPQEGQISAAEHDGCAIHDGAVKCWGTVYEEDSLVWSAVPIVKAGIVDPVYVSSYRSAQGCAVQRDGQVMCWGLRSAPELVPGIAEAKKVTSGQLFGCAIYGARNEVACWGRASKGQTGQPVESADVEVATKVSGLVGVTSLAAGTGHVCALTDQDEVWCWGDNIEQQLGLPALNTGTPQRVSLQGVPIQVAAGSTTSCALLSDGNLSCWGDGLAPVTVEPRAPAVALSVNEDSVAVLTAEASVSHAVLSTVMSGTDRWSSRFSAEVGEIREVSASVGVLALTADGRILHDGETWGYAPGGDNSGTYYGEIPCLEEMDTRPICEAATCDGDCSLVSLMDREGSSQRDQGCGLNAAGDLYCWGAFLGGAKHYDTGLAGKVVLPSTPVQMAYGGDGAAYAVLADGRVFGWGWAFLSNGSRSGPRHVRTPIQVDLPPTQSVVLGFGFACALLHDETVSCWGLNTDGRVGSPNVGSSIQTPVPVAGLSGVTSLAAGAVVIGSDVVCAVNGDGQVYCWGENSYEQLWVGGASTYTPQPIANTAGAIDIQLSFHGASALLATGEIVEWGTIVHRYREPTASAFEPWVIDDVAGATRIERGEKITCFIDGNEHLTCFGNGGLTRIGVSPYNPEDLAMPMGTQAIADVQISYETSCARTAAGVLECWGEGINGRLGNGLSNYVTFPTAVPGLGSVVDFSMGEAANCALESTGVVMCWGGSQYDRLNLARSAASTNTAIAAPVEFY